MKMGPIKPNSIYIEDKEEIKIKGFVEIINGNTRIKANNKLVQSMLAWYANVTSFHHTYDYYYYLGTNSWNIYLGSDIITPTYYNTTALTTQIGGGASTLSGATNNPSNGVFNIVFTGTWNIGVISGTVGEMGLYLSVRGTLQPFAWTIGTGSGTVTEARQLVSRLSVADGSFSPFTINISNPLTINWTIQYTF